MTIQITGRHFDITQPLRQYVHEKMRKLDRHFDHILDIRVILAVAEKDKQCAEAIVNVPGTEFVAKAEDYDMYSAIDLLEDKLDAQVRKHKQKLKGHRAERLKAEEIREEEETHLDEALDDYSDREE